MAPGGVRCLLVRGCKGVGQCRLLCCGDKHSVVASYQTTCRLTEKNSFTSNILQIFNIQRTPKSLNLTSPSARVDVVNDNKVKTFAVIKFYERKMY